MKVPHALRAPNFSALTRGSCNWAHRRTDGHSHWYLKRYFRTTSKTMRARELHADTVALVPRMATPSMRKPLMRHVIAPEHGAPFRRAGTPSEHVTRRCLSSKVLCR